MKERERAEAKLVLANICKYEDPNKIEENDDISVEEAIDAMLEFRNEGLREDEMIKLIRIARKGSHVTYGNQTHWEFDIDREKAVIDEYLKTKQ